MGEEESTDASDLDFLYVDHDRIGLLLSQFGNDGVLKEIIRQTESSSGNERALSIKVVKLDAKEQEKESLSKRFDARWLIPLLFLDAIKDRLKTDLYSCTTGSLVKSNGTLSLIDTSIIQKLYEGQTMQQVSMKKARHAAKERGEQFDADAAKIELDALSNLPHQLQMYLYRGAEPRVWATLRQEGLTTPAAEIGMSHGNIMDGEWHVVGILDSYPDDAERWDGMQKTLSDRFSDRPFLNETVVVNGLLRRAYGRPFDCYGVIPLIIYRKIH